MHSLAEQIESIKNMLLPRKTDYSFESYVSNIASPVTNNVRILNGPRLKNCDRLRIQLGPWIFTEALN